MGRFYPARVDEEVAGVKAEAETLGMDATWMGPATLDVTTDVDDVTQAINSGSQGLLLCAFVAAAFTSVLETAKSDHSPVVTINCDASSPSLRIGIVGTVGSTFGLATAEHLASVIGKSKKPDIVADQSSLSPPLQND